MNSMYGLSHFWQQGDVIIKMVAIILLIMSVLSWVVIAYKIIKFWRLRHQQRSYPDPLQSRSAFRYCSAAWRTDRQPVYLPAQDSTA